ncbi:MAG: type IV pilus secretin PilQ [Aeromonas sp.]
MRSTFKLSQAALLIGLCGGQSAWAAAILEEVKINPLNPQSLVLELNFSEPVSHFTDRLTVQPNQVRLHVSDAKGALPTNPLRIERQGVRKLSLSEAGTGLDVAVDLANLMPYQVRQQGKQLLVTLGAANGLVSVASATAAAPVPVAAPQGSALINAAVVAAQTGAATSRPPAAPSQAQTLPATTPAPFKATTAPVASRQFNQVDSVDFRRGKQGEGELLVNLANSAAAVDVTRRGAQIVAKFHGTDVPARLQNLINVQDFATPVSSIEVTRQGNDSVLTINTQGEVDFNYDQANALFVLSVKKVSANATPKVKTYQGKPISLNFQDIPVRTVLQLIADFNNLNLVTTDSVDGNITLRLDGVPWEQALDIILKVRGLDKRLEDNILLVAPADELATREKQQMENRNQVAELAPLVTEYLQINYAKASEVASLLSSESTKLLSARGAVSVDERTNMLVIKDTREVMDNVRRMLQILDIPVKQVVIEARMVTIDDGFDEALGVRWGVTKNDGHGNSISGSLEGNDDSDNDNGSAGMVRPGIDQRLNVNLPVTNAAGTLAFQVARLADGTLLDLELSALERENKAEIIASPRVTTANQKAAMIEQGTELPYVESSSSGATSVTFKKAVLSLKVTPQITPDDRVILDLTVTQDTKGETVDTATGPAVSINAQSITTQVLVSNGETLVLGGIYQQAIKNDVTKVPLLGDIPGLGALFRKTTSENKKRELLIFVTPKIVTETL